MASSADPKNNSDLNNVGTEMSNLGYEEDETMEEMEEKLPDEDVESAIEKTEDTLDESDVDGRRRARKVNNNTYVAKKTAAQGLMDFALLTANANQLRYIMEYSSSPLTFGVNVTLITISLLLQICVGITLVFQGRYYYRGESKQKRCKDLKNFIIIGVFLITIVNVFIASFTQIVPRDQLINSTAT